MTDSHGIARHVSRARAERLVAVTALIGTPYGLDQAAVDAVRQWKFRPGTRNGEPVDVFFNLTVNFKLDGSSETVLGVGGIIGQPTPQRTPLTTLILVRHAESGAAPPNDPVLTAEGQQRAERLARMFGNTRISAIYTTPFARTRPTAAPLVAARALTPVEVTDVTASHFEADFCEVNTQSSAKAVGRDRCPALPCCGSTASNR